VTTLAIIGSQEVSREKWIIATEMIWTYLEKNSVPWLVVISGGAVGIDTLAYAVSVQLGLHFEEYAPTYTELKNKGFEKYKPRNIRIAHDCDKMLCIRTTESKTFGSGWTMEYAKRLGKEVEYHLL
jgi:hypothetical protein